MKDEKKTRKKLMDESVECHERKKVEEEVRNSEELLKAVLDASDEIIFAKDLNSRYTHANATFSKKFNRPLGEIVGKTDEDIFTDKEARLLREIDLEVFKKGKVDSREDVLLVDGETRIFKTTKVPIRNEDGRIIGLSGFARDITESKQMEEKLRFERAQLLSIFDSINEIIYVTDPKTYEVLYVNKTLKYAFKKDPVGGICYKEFQGFDSPCEFCTNEIILKEKGKPYQWEYHNPVLDRDYLIVDKIIKWPDGRDVRFELAIDITEWKKAEEDVLEAEKVQSSVYKISEAAHSSKNLEELYHLIHHVITELMPAKNNFYIALYNSDSDMLDFAYFVDECEDNPGPQKFGRGLTEYVIRTGKPLLASPEVLKKLEKEGEIELIGPPSIDWLGVPLIT
ncbi:MAG: PAS domain-containing protein, partial [Candidatus Aminicenantes bacterium]|nr:PAS domain-containing protein [Candidatus Aminicenantes bacterium]